jgi:hypothetical protein
MPRVVLIEGSGPMACSTYGEMTAAVDRAFKAPRDQPLPMRRELAGLWEEARLAPPLRPERAPELPGPEPG